MMSKIKLSQEEALRQQQGWQVKETCQSQGWLQVVLPLLEGKIKSAVVDPRKFKDEAEYIFAQKTAWAYGQAYSDLLNILDLMQEEAEGLTKKEKGENVDKLAEAMS